MARELITKWCAAILVVTAMWCSVRGAMMLGAKILGLDSSARVAAQPSTPDPPLPRITRFVASPSTVEEGGSVLLEWESLHATEGQLDSDGLPGGGPVPPSGTIEFEDVRMGVYELELVVRNDAEPPRSDRASTVVTVTAAADGVIVDDLDEAFRQFGTPDFWNESGIGFREHMFFTYANGSEVDNFAEWHPALPECGVYRVSVFVPRQHATTQSARYEVHHADGVRLVPVDQSPHSDDWVSLGEFSFEPGSDAFLRLSDATGEDPDLLRQIGFDAARWELERPCSEEIYLPHGRAD